jgi:hypothetical protein
MRFDYMTRDEERSLVSFFSERTLSLTFSFAALVAFFLVLMWPKGSLYDYLREQGPPLTFLFTFEVTLIMLSYLNLRWGGGELFRGNEAFTLLDKRFTSLEEETGFFFYGLVGFLLHVLLLLSLCLPLLIASAAVSGESISVFAMALAVLFGSALICRLGGFLIHLLCRHRWIAFHLARVFYLLFFLASAFLPSFVNPVIMIYLLHKEGKVLSRYPVNGYLLYVMFTATMVLFLSLAAECIIRRRMRERESS